MPEPPLSPAPLEVHKFYGGPFDGAQVTISDPKVLPDVRGPEMVWLIDLFGQPLKTPVVYTRGTFDPKTKVVPYTFAGYAERYTPAK